MEIKRRVQKRQIGGGKLDEEGTDGKYDVHWKGPTEYQVFGWIAVETEEELFEGSSHLLRYIREIVSEKSCVL